MLKFRWFSRSTFPAKEAAAQLLKKHLLLKNTCQIVVFKIRVITKVVCSFLFSKKIEEGSYFELFVKFPFFFFKIGIFPPKHCSLIGRSGNIVHNKMIVEMHVARIVCIFSFWKSAIGNCIFIILTTNSPFYAMGFCYFFVFSLRMEAFENNWFYWWG